jgi:hypothetical protein
MVEARRRVADRRAEMMSPPRTANTVPTGLGYAGKNTQVRKTPSWPISWAKFSRLWLYSYWNARANLHLLSQPNTLLAAALRVAAG